MKSIYRLKKNYQYNYVYKHAMSVSDRHIVVLYCKSNNSIARVGFSVSKKHGKAVKRNRLRRQLKAAMSQYVPTIKQGYNIIIIPRQEGEYVFEQICQSLQQLLNKGGLLNE